MKNYSQSPPTFSRAEKEVCQTLQRGFKGFPRQGYLCGFVRRLRTTVPYYQTRKTHGSCDMERL